MPVMPHLRAVRERRMLSQAELAARSGVAQPTISRLERGHTSAQFSTIRKLAKVLRVAPAVLVDGDTNESSRDR